MQIILSNFTKRVSKGKNLSDFPWKEIGKDFVLVFLLDFHVLGFQNIVVLLWGRSVCQKILMSKDEEITRASGGIREGNSLEPIVAAQNQALNQENYTSIAQGRLHCKCCLWLAFLLSCYKTLNIINK